MEETANTAAAVEAIRALAVAASNVHAIQPDRDPFVIVPDGYALQPIERKLAAPTRCRGTVHVRDMASFIAVVKSACAPATRIYRTVQPPRFVAVFDDHDAERPGWGEHRADYACPLSVEWGIWAKQNKTPMDQAAFAQFIEDNLLDIVEPASADMLEISRTLQAKKKISFASGIHLPNGQTQFTYEEQIDGIAGAKGQLSVPEVFTVGIPVVEGGARYALKCRLRYRIAERGALVLWYDIERPHKVIEAEVEELRQVIERETGMGTINGTPPSAAERAGA